MQTNSLESAFLRLCERQDSNKMTKCLRPKPVIVYEENEVEKLKLESSLVKRASMKILKVESLLKKNILQFVRRPA